MKLEHGKPITILLADDDPDDRLLTKHALEENRLVNDLRFAENGEELIDYLRRRQKFADPDCSPRPGLFCSTSTCRRKMAGKRWKRSKATRICARFRW